MPNDGPSIFLAGDAMVVRPWSHVDDPAFVRLIEEIRAADVSIVNLETVIHEYRGYAQRDSGGIHLGSPPAIASELKWAGFNMLAHANNHTFDYGSSAVLETLQHVTDAGLVLAGAGPDLNAARSPRYAPCKNSIVGLVAMASTFVPYGAASCARPDLHGRPGLNPLTVTDKERAIIVPSSVAEFIRAFGRVAGRNPKKLRGRSFRIGVRFHVGRSFGVERGCQLTEIDREANLAAIAEAARRADIVVASIHAHHQGRWLREFARDAIRCGANIVFVHGPHEVRGVELCDDKPIFYSMGDFAFEVESVAKLPAEVYERAGLGDDAMPSDIFAMTRKPGSRLFSEPKTFEGFAAKVSIVGNRVTGIRLLPIDLQFDAPDERRGRPQLAAPPMGKRIVEQVAALSRPFGTRIHYDEYENCGRIEIS